MASTSWRLACDACGTGAWIGPARDSDAAFDTWCEACQSSERRARVPAAGDTCSRCGAPLAASPRFVELWGELQHLDAVLGAWAGDPRALVAILPERPRFLTDLDPPAPALGDPPARAAALASLARGDWHGALSAPEDPDRRMHGARAIAYERLGDAASALRSWDALLAEVEDARARLARGALRARMGRVDDAAEDLALAGRSFEARWNRAACLVHRAVEGTDGLPDATVLARARAEAGEASAYWSDGTVGRLLWSLLVERELARLHARELARLQARELATPRPIDASVRATLRAAESQFEHATFWDRAMVVAGWSRLGALDECKRVAAPLARAQAEALLAEPALRGAPLQPVAEAVRAAVALAESGDPAGARAAIAPALGRDDLRHFRIPCARCGRGTVGVEETAEVEAGEA